MNTIPIGNPNAVVEFLNRSASIQASQFSFQQAYGSFSSTQTQSIAVLPNRTALTYNTTDLAGGGVILSGSTPTADILLPASANYRVITSVQLDKQAGGASTTDIYVWFALDGTAVPNTATKTQIANGEEVVMTVEVLLTIQAGQTLSIQAGADTTNARALAVSAGSPVPPAVPSIITIVQRIA